MPGRLDTEEQSRHGPDGVGSFLFGRRLGYMTAKIHVYVSRDNFHCGSSASGAEGIFGGAVLGGSEAGAL